MPWFPGDPGSPGGPGVGGLATRTRVALPPPGDGAAPQPGDDTYLPQRRLTMLSGHVFPAAVSPIGPVPGRYFGDAGDGEHPINEGGRGSRARYPQDAGRDLISDGGAQVQWAPPFWGMRYSAVDFRNRFFVALDEPNAAGRPQFAPRSMAMRPSATALHPRIFGEPGGVQTRRMVAPGRVTRWEQPSLVWPEFGSKGGR